MRDLAKKRLRALESYYRNREARLIYDRDYHKRHREARAAKKRRQREVARSLRTSWQKIDRLGELFCFTLGQLENPSFVFECNGKRRYETLREPLPWKAIHARH